MWHLLHRESVVVQSFLLTVVFAYSLAIWVHFPSDDMGQFVILPSIKEGFLCQLLP